VTLATTLQASSYIDPAVYERERTAVFRPAWFHIGFTHQFERAGDYVTEDVAGWSIFVQRGTDGVLRGFHNVCPHRAGPIMWDGVGCQTNLVCRYHGWVFEPDGSLRNARDFGEEESGDCLPTDIALAGVRVATWRTFVFVCLDSTTPDLLDWLGGFPAECLEYPIESYEFHTKTVRPMACNWKTYTDNFLEGYHVPITHGTTLNREIDGLGYRVVTKNDRRWNIHVSSARKNDAWSTGIFVYFWPNFSLNIFPEGYAVERWLPRGPHHTDLIFEYFFAPGVTNADSIIEASEEVGREDAEMSVLVQRNLASGVYTTGLLSPRHENGLLDFKELLAEAMEKGEPVLH
jgi:choline monooxygenase